MDGILSWGLDAIRWVQTIASPGLTTVVGAITFLGSQWFMIGVLLVVYWCIDRRRGARLALLVSVSAALNALIKIWVAEPRPYDLDRSVGLAEEETYAFPSGHSQNTATFFGAAGLSLRRRSLGWFLALGLPFIVGLSRVYLGVHYPTDVLAGWAFGAAFVAAERLFGDRIEAALNGTRDTLTLALAAALALGMNAAGIGDHSISGSFFGLAVGLIYAPKAAPFRVDGDLWKKALRLVVGATGLAIVYFGMKLVLSPLAEGSPDLVRFLRYALLGAGGSLGAPWLFLKLRLAERDHSA